MESTMLHLCSAHTVVGMRHKEYGVEIVLLLLLLWLIMFRVYLRGSIWFDDTREESQLDILQMLHCFCVVILV